MMHVAEAGEAKGRVVLQVAAVRPSLVAIEAAIWVAQAFQSEIESLFVEDQQLIEMASFPFAREVSLTGRSSRSISCRDIEQDMRAAFNAYQSQIERMAREAEVPVRPRVVRDEPVNALATACAECGPWNVIAIAEPFTSPACPPLRQLLDTVSGTTGIVLVGPKARRARGPIALALEDTQHLPGMLLAGERLAGVHEEEMVICLIGSDEAGLSELEAQSRLVLAERANARIVASQIARGAPAAAAEALRRLEPGLVIAQFGGLVIPEEGDLRPLAVALECPMLLLR